uniref:Uncharacterized protein n=1 Tax=Arundo donax TaxID=35708 RepID=A0A0A8YLU0_ARUDO
MMPSLKTLAVELKHRSTGYVNWLMQLLELFPCLETLYIRSEIGPMNQAAAPQSWNVLRSVPCVGNHLEKVVFEVYRGHEWQRDLAKFLHRRSGFLKAMEFHCMDDPRTGFISSPPSEQWVRKQQKLLCLDTRASMDAGFLFFKHHLPSNHHDICRHHYRDISLRKWYERNYYNNLYEV